MILKLKIKNFRSIKSSVEIDFTREKRLLENEELKNNIASIGNNDILKSVVVYGRNASGKSNILMALKALNYLVYNSDKFKYKSKIQAYEPYGFDVNTIKAPVEIEIEFILPFTKHKYIYSIKYNATSIVYESLSYYQTNTPSKLYERVNMDIVFGENYRGARKKIEADTLENQLFLSKSASSKIEHLNEVYRYFTEDLDITNIANIVFDDRIIRVFSEITLKDEKLKRNLLKLLKAADTNISDFSVIETEQNIEGLKNLDDKLRKLIIDRNKYQVLTKHRLFNEKEEIGEANLNFNVESLGTKKLFAIGSQILNKLEYGGVIVIDELDKGLHPILTRLLINLFNSKKNNPHNAQLIFATHDSTLLDNELFRRDQICFVDKEYEGNTIFYRLSDIKGVRKDIPIGTWYLSGRFRAIPVVDNSIQLEF